MGLLDSLRRVDKEYGRGSDSPIELVFLGTQEKGKIGSESLPFIRKAMEGMKIKLGMDLNLSERCAEEIVKFLNGYDCLRLNVYYGEEQEQLNELDEMLIKFFKKLKENDEEKSKKTISDEELKRMIVKGGDGARFAKEQIKFRRGFNKEEKDTIKTSGQNYWNTQIKSKLLDELKEFFEKNIDAQVTVGGVLPEGSNLVTETTEVYLNTGNGILSKLIFANDVSGFEHLSKYAPFKLGLVQVTKNGDKETKILTWARDVHMKGKPRIETYSVSNSYELRR
jgi:hypothetical protein